MLTKSSTREEKIKALYDANCDGTSTDTETQLNEYLDYELDQYDLFEEEEEDEEGSEEDAAGGDETHE